MECEFCQNHEQGDTLYESSDWDGGIGFDYIRDIKYCPLCGSLLNGEVKTKSIIGVYNGNADKENWQCITIKPIEDEPKPCETCRHWKYIAKEFQCETTKCQGYESIEPQTDW